MYCLPLTHGVFIAADCAEQDNVHLQRSTTAAVQIMAHTTEENTPICKVLNVSMFIVFVFSTLLDRDYYSDYPRSSRIQVEHSHKLPI